ncbi:MAG: hypothetical protein J6V92_10105 [Bacteroidaceae bacterium]|nr:hypothetical protein [Bacteroidaceae bacterium]
MLVWCAQIYGLVLTNCLFGAHRLKIGAASRGCKGANGLKGQQAFSPGHRPGYIVRKEPAPCKGISSDLTDNQLRADSRSSPT